MKLLQVMQIIKNIGLWIYELCKKLSFKDYVLILVSIIALGFCISSRYYYKKSLYPTVVYKTDSLDVYKNKLKEVYKEKTVYVQTVDQLKEENSELYQEIKNLKDQPIVVTKTSIKTELDTIYMESDSVIEHPVDSTYNLIWHSTESNGYYNISGNTLVKSDFSNFSTQMNKLYIPGTLSLDVIEKDKKLSIIGKVDNPYITITNSDGAVIDPTQSSVIKSYFKQKRWHIGPQLGVGVTSDLKIRPYIGIGISYGLIHF